MNPHYEARLEEAKRISDKIKDISDSVVVVGSVAYNPSTIHEKSDLDMVVVLKATSFTDFKDFYGRLGVEYDAVADECFSRGKANVLPINMNKGFPVGLAVWDYYKTLEEIVFLSEIERIGILREPGFNRPSRSEILQSFSGKIHRNISDREEYKGRVIQKVPQYAEDYGDRDIYFGVMLTNLLLNPVVLHQTRGMMDFLLKKTQENLKKQIKKVYRETKFVSVVDALPEKIRKQVPDDLRIRLNSYLNNQ